MNLWNVQNTFFPPGFFCVVWKSSSVKGKKFFFYVKYSWNLFTSGSMTRAALELVLSLSLTVMDSRALLCGTGLSSEVWMWGHPPPGGTGHHTLPGAGTAWKAGPYFERSVPMRRSVLRHPAGFYLSSCQIKEVTQYWKDEAEAMWPGNSDVSQENKKEVQQFLCQTLEVTNIRTNISLISYISHWTADRNPFILAQHPHGTTTISWK